MRHGDELPKKYNLSKIRLFTCAGEPLNPEALQWAYRVICGNGKTGFVADNWWQTETGGPCLGTMPIIPARPAKAGKALPGVIAEVVDPRGNRMPPNKGGLLVLRRPFPHMFRTVYGDPERYAQDWGKVPNAYTTGDVAICDEDGYFTVVGRADDVLNVAGHRIGTADVEGALVSHPAVGEAAVIGRPRRNQRREHQGIRHAACGPCGIARAGRQTKRPCASHTGIHRRPGGNCLSR